MLKALLRPESIAVIGASTHPSKVGYKILQNLLHSGYEGRIVPVNPNADRLLGLRCYRSLADFGEPVDQAVIVIPRKFVETAVRDALDAGVRAVTVISAGFKEQDQEGARLERDLVALCRAAGARMLGPNCLGLLHTHHRMNASFASQWPAAGGISFISQSGALMTAILDHAVGSRLGVDKMVSMGNKADICETDLLHALGRDDRTKAVVAYVESIDSGAAFMDAAGEVSRLKPVIVFKSGVTQAGSKAASSHTGSLAGADTAYEAAFRRSGILRAYTFEQMFEFAAALSMQALPRGRNVAVVTNAGGPGIMAADALELCGMRLPALSAPVAAELRQALSPAASVANPIDVLGDAAPEHYVAALRAAHGDPAIDAILVLLTPQSVTEPEATAQAIVRCALHDKPVLACWMGGEDVRSGRRVFQAAGIPDYTSPERAVHALHSMCRYAEWKRRPPRRIEPLPVDRAAVAQILEAHRSRGLSQIAEPEAKAVFRAYGIRTAPGGLAATADEAVTLAERVGYPVAIKIVSTDVLHKSDVGGVRLHVASSEAVRKVFGEMLSGIAAQRPTASLRGVYVERMCPPGGHEVIIGMSRDPQFGPLLMFGLGGIFVEVLKDVTFRAAPVTAQEADEMIRDIRAFPVLEGLRGQPGADLHALRDCLRRAGQLVADFPEIQEMDINPFIAGAVPETSMAADARMTLRLPG